MRVSHDLSLGENVFKSQGKQTKCNFMASRRKIRANCDFKAKITVAPRFLQFFLHLIFCVIFAKFRAGKFLFASFAKRRRDNFSAVS